MSYSVHAERGELLVIYRPNFSLFRLLFFPAWTAIWVTIAIHIGVSQPKWVPILLFLFFGAGTLWIAYLWLLDLAGREELEFASDALTVRRVLFGISRTRTFQIGKIADPRFVEPRRRGMSGSMPSFIQFSHAGQKTRICEHVSQAEAKEIATVIVQGAPEHAETWKSYIESLPEVRGYVTLDLK
jgi:hypothetical protein